MGAQVCCLSLLVYFAAANFSDQQHQQCTQAVCLCVARPTLLRVVQSEDSDTVWEYLVRDDNAEWQHWRELVPSWKYPKEQERPKFSQLVIPTLDSVRYEKLLTLSYSVQKVALLIPSPLITLTLYDCAVASCPAKARELQCRKC